MVNPFLSSTNYDLETAVMLERAFIVDIKDAVAYTDGDRVFLNTEENLTRLLPAYNDDMLKWLLWHERIHMELKHHNRFFNYLDKISSHDLDTLHISKDEVNIIMDILVHDWMEKKFPELVSTAKENLAQFRNRNQLKYTFKTFTLEEMLDEYNKFKDGKSEHKDEKSEHKESDSTSGSTPDSKSGSTPDSKSAPKDDKDDDTKDTKKHERGSGNSSASGADIIENSAPPEDESEQEEANWDGLKNIDTNEFIQDYEGDKYIRAIEKLKRTKLKLAKLTQTLNALVTTTKTRSYKRPNYMITGQHTIFKGQNPSKAALYLCFDASGSMGSEMQLFKDIIKDSIPQALQTPTTWFSGWGEKISPDPEGRNPSDYFKGTFKDFVPIQACSGYSDDGDRTIELCYKAEQLGYSPIGVTDGGGKISWSTDLLKQLKRTILIGDNDVWLKKAQNINPRIQIIIIK